MRLRSWPIAALVLAGALVAPARADRPCESPSREHYTETAMTMTYSVDLASCGLAGRVGTVTMTASITRTDVVSGGTERARAKPVRCRSGVKVCTISMSLRHPPTEWARYEIVASYDSTDQVVTGTQTVFMSCVSVAAAYVNCALLI